MNILLISQCDKRALVETRRILDQFAERRGERTWQTPITQAGLDTLRRLLRKAARKNTAVSCHWIRGLDHSELLWIVGDRSRFNDEGAAPTNTTTRNVLRSRDENDWHTGEDIVLLVTLSGLLHDLGKASAAFQQRLRSIEPPSRNLYRHEWTSVRLFQAFVGDSDDAGWLARLAQPSAEDDGCWIGRLQRDGLASGCDKPFARLPPLAQAAAWLVLTHHRLPVRPGGNGRRLGAKLPPFNPTELTGLLAQVDAAWNEQCDETAHEKIAPYWSFPQGLPVTTRDWRHRATRVARRLLNLLTKPGKGGWVSNPYVMHLSRLALMLADHHYSGLTKPGDPQRVAGEPDYPLAANTRFDDARGQRVINQTLDEHLVGVARLGGELSHALPRFELHLPRLTRHKGLKRRSVDASFRWQDQAADLAASMRPAADVGGAFLVNMASTGCGKTLANARVMYALADPQLGMRCSFALGLRTLTLQTGRAYRATLKLGDDELAIRVGGAVSRELYEFQTQKAEAQGSASVQPLLDDGDDEGGVLYEGDTSHPLLTRAFRDPAMRALLAAPVLTCTIDHLVPATESQRGGRQIAPMLRLMSSDLVLDELDDFEIDDLPAVARLVHWAGMLGARVLISSATLPPALVQGMFEAYRNGRGLYASNRGQRPGQVEPVACAWIDEFEQRRLNCADGDSFREEHACFVKRRYETLREAPARRRMAFSVFAPGGGRRDLPESAAKCMLDGITSLHRRYAETDPVTGRQVSFGLVRMANIGPLVEVALALYRQGAPAGMRLHLCVYHSRYPLLMRSSIEAMLDRILRRHDPGAVFSQPEVRNAIDAHDEADQVFVVLGSPVTEVGRDHDYDWAVVEPSSMRSIIQLAGRVWRHRPQLECAEPNVVVLDRNLRFWRHRDQAAFRWPGFETGTAWRLDRKPLDELLRASERDVIDARSRIRAQPQLQWRQSFVDLEHARLEATMLAESPQGQKDLCAHHWWSMRPADATLAAVLQQQQPFRENTGREVEACLMFDEDGTALHLFRVPPPQRRKRGEEAAYIEADAMLDCLPEAAVQGQGILPWGVPDYLATLTDVAESRGMSLEACGRRYGQVILFNDERGWSFHPALGFTIRAQVR